jgi:hypothetical protein
VGGLTDLSPALNFSIQDIRRSKYSISETETHPLGKSQNPGQRDTVSEIPGKITTIMSPHCCHCHCWPALLLKVRLYYWRGGAAARGRARVYGRRPRRAHTQHTQHTQQQSPPTNDDDRRWHAVSGAGTTPAW